MKKMLSTFLTIALLITGFTTVSVFAQASYAMKVVADGTTTYYDNFGVGWTEAITLAKTTPTTVTLGKDWLAGDTNNNGIIDGNETSGSFLYYRDNVECGTEKGSLLVTGNLNLTIDINGHVIDRGLNKVSAIRDNGQVFTVTDGANLTIKDSGTYEYARITGGMNTGDGGGFCVTNLATLTLNSGRICGNKAEKGGGVYVCNASFYMNGGSVDFNSAENGAGIALGRKYGADKEFIVCKGGKISQNYASKSGGGVSVFSAGEDSVITFENTEISGNEADGTGGGVYTWFDDENCEVVFGNGTVIKQNTADEGGGIYVGSGSLRFIGAQIIENDAHTRCGGVGIDDDMDDNAHGNIVEYGKYIFGGNTYIQENYILNSGAASNLRIGDLTCDIFQDVNNPLTKGASIGIDMYDHFGTEETEEKLSDAEANFGMDSYKYFTVDNPNYVLAARDGGSDGANRYQIYVEMAENAMDIGVQNASLNKLFASNTVASVDEKNKILTFTVNPKMKGCLENSALYDVADFSFSSDVVGIANGNKVQNLFDAQWQIKAKNNNYELWQINFVPYGGAWSAEDGGAARVTVNGVTKHYADFESAWIDALDASVKQDALLVLNKDWYAGDSDADGMIDEGEKKGYFKVEKNGSEYGTNKGRLYLDDNIRLTIDLNGHILSRNLDEAVADGQVFSMQDKDIILTIKDSVGGGKITGGNNTGNGGAFYVYNGSINLQSGEISGNKATNGAGIYWYSDNNLCITGGKITNNTATENGGGIYGTDEGDMYFGGTVVISDNKGRGSAQNNLYLSDSGVFVNRTAGQSDKIPDVPFLDGASIGISMPSTNDTVLISGLNSRFDSNNFGYFFGDHSSYFVRAVFDEAGANNTHKLYYNQWGYKDAVYPKIATVTPRKNNGLISEASINLDKQIITLKAISPDKSLFKSVVVESLVSFTTSNDSDVYWRFCDVAFDLSKPMEYKVVSKSTGTYVHCRVVVEFPDCTHDDKDGNFICDICEDYTLEEFTILDYNTQKATVFAPVSGRYAVVFANYENDHFANADVVEYDFKAGINVIPQKVINFTLASGDKVMLWKASSKYVPVCDALILK